MVKKFNTTAVCIPSKHYMVDLSERVREIKELVDAGKYFTINRARQYGKTTTLRALQQRLRDEYLILSLSFEGISEGGYQTEGEFVQTMSRLILDRNEFFGLSIPSAIAEKLESFCSQDSNRIKLDELYREFRRWIVKSDRPIVMFIDEVDSATNNQVFLDFLALLRDGYIARESEEAPAFQSVILAGVTDVKHLKRKIRQDEESKDNSPWNIAADFTIDMSLSDDGIKGMLEDYESDHHTGMDTVAIARQIRDYTSGYPFLVSRICQMLDENKLPEPFESLSAAWTAEGVERAVKAIITEKNTLFDSLMSKIRDYDRLRKQMEYMLFRGETIEYLPDNREQEQLMMYGFIVNNHNTVAIANRIFEMRLLRYFAGESQFAQEMKREALRDKPDFIQGGELNIPLIMSRFIESQKIIRNMNDEAAERRFIEEEGRERFVTYLSPIINGVGTYSIEDQTSDLRRMDLVVHYHGKRYIIELKIWHGERYNKKGEEQIIGYLDHYGLSTGYMLSFNFNKNKKPGVEEVHIGDKLLYEGIV